MTLLAWGVFLLAAALEATGDAVIRKGMRGAGLAYMAAGFLVLGSYGFVINLVRWNFSKLMGVYIAIFALTSILTGRFLFKETIPHSTWLGLILIICGGLVIQFGRR
jgi:drug/metabolite transporter (DMT)-like permease